MQVHDPNKTVINCSSQAQTKLISLPTVVLSQLEVDSDEGAQSYLLMHLGSHIHDFYGGALVSSPSTSTLWQQILAENMWRTCSAPRPSDNLPDK